MEAIENFERLKKQAKEDRDHFEAVLKQAKLAQEAFVVQIRTDHERQTQKLIKRT